MKRPILVRGARQLLTLPKQHSLEEWLHTVPEHASDAQAGHAYAEALETYLQPAAPPASSEV